MYKIHLSQFGGHSEKITLKHFTSYFDKLLQKLAYTAHKLTCTTKEANISVICGFSSGK